MHRKTTHKLTMASLVLAIVFSAPAFGQVANEQMMNLVTQVQQLQDEIRSLRGQIEEQSYEIEELKRRQRDQYLDLDQRISGLTGGQGAAASSPAATGPAVSAGQPTPPPATGSTGAAVPPSGGPSAADVPALGRADEGPEVRAPVDAPSTTTALPDPQAASRTAAANPEMEQAAYDEAFQALRELRYADAARMFQSFLDSYPNSQLADNAQYWLGESYYVTRNYDMALDAFQTLNRQYPDSTKAGDGLLKIGYTHYELRQYDQARAALEQVQQQYPNTPLSRLAENRLRSMRLEGHL